eukprot:7546758-Lingulodinium_polyedra.AAC.1
MSPLRGTHQLHQLARIHGRLQRAADLLLATQAVQEPAGSLQRRRRHARRHRKGQGLAQTTHVALA